MPPSQRRRRPVDDEGDSEEDARPRQRQHIEASDAEQDEDMSDDDPEVTGASSTADNQMAKKLVRYAISCEYSRTAIRRDGIKERVLGKQGRSFRRIFELAQTQLRTVWGMELRELPVREKMTLHEKRQAKDRVGRLYPVFNIARRIPKRIDPEAIQSSKRGARSNIFRILHNGRFDDMAKRGELSEQKLQRYLMRLNADRMLASERTEVAMKRIERQGYVIKKVDRPPVGYEGDQTITWHVGPRAKEEIGLDGVIGLVREVYGHPEDEAFDKKLRSSLGIKNRPLTEGGEDYNDAGMTNGV
ncbi:hypothetical protein TrVFT333_001976 [Trichoderma virens FT-333]|nr:hypothetical protein TrVFT333_001976 [Trichoderma virens FT-333]